MKRNTFLERKKAWARFQEWEEHQQLRSPKKTFSAIGEWVDFFLSKHRGRFGLPDVHGIQKMHKRLSRLSRNI